MFNPTYNLYAAFNNKLLSIIEIRELLGNQEEVIFNDKAHYNGEPINKEELVSYYKLWLAESPLLQVWDG